MAREITEITVQPVTRMMMFYAIPAISALFFFGAVLFCRSAYGELLRRSGRLWKNCM
jgi:hypothetical protein